jgi:activator of 2-hydroxyglutaryl-CoA dehydratase
MAIEVIGISTGSTSFKLELMHDGHADYTSTNNVPIVVN